MGMGTHSGSGLRRLSLRRAIWRTRLAAKAIRDNSTLSGPERHATELLRASVRQQVKAAVTPDIPGVYAVADDWRTQVLEHDPQVVCARSEEDVLDALESEEPVDILATRESRLTVERLRELCEGRLEGKSVYLET
jgi:hypothetical protein